MFNASALPLQASACWNPYVDDLPEMLQGSALGDALRSAMERKGVTQQQVATHFGIKQSSVSEWLKFGRIAKRHLPRLVAFFSPQVGPEHWGLPPAWGEGPLSEAAMDIAAAFDARVPDHMRDFLRAAIINQIELAAASQLPKPAADDVPTPQPRQSRQTLLS